MIIKVLKKSWVVLGLAGVLLLGPSRMLFGAAEVRTEEGRSISATPYDRRLSEAGALTTYGPAQNTRGAEELFNQARAFRYEPDGPGQDYWQTPAETQTRWAGDCEDKAIWLYAQLKNNGYRGVRLVVGRHSPISGSLHVWVTLEDSSGGGSYLLDPTTRKRIWNSTDFPEGFYKPLYSFDGLERYRHDL